MTDDPFNLQRFVEAQETQFAVALHELGLGQKASRWMWFIFPQLSVLGRSHRAWFYGLSELAEAKAYLAHPLLGPRLMACVNRPGFRRHLQVHNSRTPLELYRRQSPV